MLEVFSGTTIRLLLGLRHSNPLRMDFYFDCYAELSLQRFMVSDMPRTGAFAAAIKECVKGGEIVVDLGAGTGLLALLAKKAGAAKVYAVDRSNIVEAARETVARNGFSDTVEIIQSNAAGLQLEEPVDILVSEWLGHFAFAESMLDDVIECRDRNLKEGGVMLPSGIELFLAPVDSSILYIDEGPGFWREPIHGIDFSHLESMELEQAVAIKTTVPSGDILAPGVSLLSLDLAKAGKEDRYCSGSLEFMAVRTGKIDGFAGWFVAQLSPSVCLSTSPDHPSTHWEQTFYPFPARRIEKGERIKVDFVLSRHPVEARSMRVELGMDGGSRVFTVG